MAISIPAHRHDLPWPHAGPFPEHFIRGKVFIFLYGQTLYREAYLEIVHTSLEAKNFVLELKVYPVLSGSAC